LADLQIGNSITLTRTPSGGAATGNLPGGGTVDQQAVGDQLNNSNVLSARTSEVQDGVIDDVSHFFANWVNQVRPLPFLSHLLISKQNLHVKLMKT
jgi:two-component response regulator ARR-B family